MIIVERDFHGKKLSIEAGKVARQANGSVIVRCADSVVLVTACMGEERDVDFLPLSIDYIEKTYAAGKIPGGYLKREGRLGDKETLTSRLIDRPCRPLFPKGFNRELQVTATVLSADPEADTDVLALCGASAALTISDIPFDGPIAGVRVGRINGKYVINPSTAELEKSDLSFVLAGSSDAIVMVEGGAQEVPEKEVLDGLFYAQEELQAIIEMQGELREKIGKEKVTFEPKAIDEAIQKQIADFATDKLRTAIQTSEKLDRKIAIKAVKEEVKEKFIDAEADNAEEMAWQVSESFSKIQTEIARGLVFETGKRIDGRDTKTVRPIDIEVGILPRAHGSSLFTRGETQGIVAATLGMENEAQRVDGLFGEIKKKFMLHYNFPAFSVGEVRPNRGPGRREIGHGTLAERAIEQVLPSPEDFPYAIRIVSEITESNGSSSMATVCGSSLSLMDAGVPIKAPVAGIAMGLMMQGKEYRVLTDILGDEDHIGDMDFKVCGTETGLTALQMDIKIKGLDKNIMTEALEQAKAARLHILDLMVKAISEPREAVSQYAPKIVTIKINPDKIRDVIGPSGKVIKSIIESCDVQMNVEDDGTVSICGVEEDGIKAALSIVESITAEAEVGKIYRGVVKRLADYGAFVEILPGKDGLLHISQLEDYKVREVSDVVNEGDEVWVKVLGVDHQGKIRLSRKEAMQEMGEQGNTEQSAAE